MGPPPPVRGGPAWISVVPVATQIRGILRHHHNVADSDFDDPVATRAQVLLARLIGLKRVDDLRLELTARRDHPRNPHATNASVSSTKPTTRAMSSADLS